MLLSVPVSILPFLHLFICPSTPYLPKGRTQRGTLPHTLLRCLGLYNFFGQQLQEEGEGLEASLELNFEKNG